MWELSVVHWMYSCVLALCMKIYVCPRSYYICKLDHFTEGIELNNKSDDVRALLKSKFCTGQGGPSDICVANERNTTE